MPPKDDLVVISPLLRNKSLQNVRSNGNLINQSELSKVKEDDYLIDQVSYDTEEESFSLSDLVWRNINIFVILFSLFVYSVYRMIVDLHFKWQTFVTTYL